MGGRLHGSLHVSVALLHAIREQWHRMVGSEIRRTARSGESHNRSSAALRVIGPGRTDSAESRPQSRRTGDEPRTQGRNRRPQTRVADGGVHQMDDGPVGAGRQRGLLEHAAGEAVMGNRRGQSGDESPRIHGQRRDSRGQRPRPSRSLRPRPPHHR